MCTIVYLDCFMQFALPHTSRYLVSHIDDMQALVIVEHAGGFYNLYLSDESGLYFSLSLNDIVIEALYGRWQIDLELVRYVPYSCVLCVYDMRNPLLSTNCVALIL